MLHQLLTVFPIRLKRVWAHWVISEGQSEDRVGTSLETAFTISGLMLSFESNYDTGKRKIWQRCQNAGLFPDTLSYSYRCL